VLDIVREAVGSTVILRLAGDLDVAAGPILDRAMHDASRSAKVVILDLSAIGFLDTRGSLALLLARDDAGTQVHCSSWQHHRRRLSRMLRWTMADLALVILPTVAKALAFARPATEPPRR